MREIKLTAENQLTKLAELREHTFATGNYSAAVRAEELRGKVTGFYTGRIEMNNTVKMVVLDD